MRPSKSASRLRRSYRPSLQALEDRSLLATCVVNSLGDLGQGQDMRGDLRYCITQANQLFGDDIITFEVTGTINLTGALPDLSTNIDIQGPGDELLTVRRESPGYFRIFSVLVGSTVQISGMTIANGNVVSFGSSPRDGGGISNFGTLDLINVTVADNLARDGAGVWNSGTLTLVDTIISKNHGGYCGFRGCFSGSGGGVWSSGRITIIDAIISHNQSGHGGGIWTTGTMTLSNSTISANESRPDGMWECNQKVGGGIANLGNLTVLDSTISKNLGQDGGSCLDGGGIANIESGTLIVNNSTVSGNVSEFGGGIYNNFGTLTVNNSTVSKNVALVNGGGMYRSTGTLTVSNSTVTGNKAGWEGGGFYHGGVGGTLTVSHSTITGNLAGRFGGGIFHDRRSYPPPPSLRHTILASNSAALSGPDLDGVTNSQGYNLIGNSSGGSGYHLTDLLNIDPKLGPLQDNGGPNLTHSLLAGSPAIDAGHNAGAPDWDQRGPNYPRIVNGTIDIGAIEEQTPLSIALLVSSAFNNSAMRYNGKSGAFLGAFVPSEHGGLRNPHGLAIGFDGHILIASAGSSSVLRYHSTTGEFLGAFVPERSGGLTTPVDLAFGPDGNLYVSSANTRSILRYDGRTGTFLDAFVPTGSGGLARPHGIVFGPDGHLYVNSHETHSVMRYDGRTGAPLPAPGRPGAFFVASRSGGLDTPWGDLVFGRDGHLYVSSFYSDSVLRYDGTTGDFLDAFVSAGAAAA